MQNTTAWWATEAEKVGLRLEEIALLTGKSYSAVYRYKTGTRNPSVEWLSQVGLLIAKVRLENRRAGGQVA